MYDSPLVRAEGLVKHFPLHGGIFSRSREKVRAVDGIDFEIMPAETLGLVGESGSGKTTAGRCLLRLIEPTAGRVVFGNNEVTGADKPTLKNLRRRMQIIFQDPYGSLTPRMRIESILMEPLEVHNIGRPADRRDVVRQMSEQVGLRPEHLSRFPHEFSGGQRQRIAIARALMLHPELIVADEPVSALDVSIQAQIINLMVELQAKMRLSYLFISHDLSVINYVSDRIAVMYLGTIVESAPREELFSNPLHPYTKALLSAVPGPKPVGLGRKILVSGETPSPINPPPGCSFHPRCDYRREECRLVVPVMKFVDDMHSINCHLW